MRLPLNTTGQLIRLTTSGVEYNIFDMDSIPESLRDQPYALTLFGFWDNADPLETISTVEVRIYDVAAGPLLIQNVEGPAASPSAFRVVPLLEAYPLRGAGRITAARVVGQNRVTVYGYVQPQGVAEIPVSFTPLQPNAGEFGQAPYTYLPASAAALSVARVHQFDPQTPHIVNMFAYGGDGGAAVSGGTITVVDGSTAETLRFIGNNIPVFDDIPFQPSSNNPVGGLLPGIYVSTVDAADEASAWGTFAIG